jgi:myosin heavy subunit
VQLITIDELTPESLVASLNDGYQNDEIYTHVGPVLISINPFKMLNLYGPQTIANVQQNAACLSRVKPHVYNIAQRAFSAMMHEQSAQSVLVRYTVVF